MLWSAPCWRSCSSASHSQRRLLGRHRCAAAQNVLEGFRVLELASVLAGPSTGQFLGDLGADVVKVENVSAKGDVTQFWKLPQEPVEVAGGVTAYFSCCNLGKRSVAIDARRLEGRHVLHELAKKSDIVLASYRPGDAAKLGVDAACLRGLNPRLIYAELTGYGDDDPRVGYDAVIQAEAGVTFMNGEADGGPVKMPVALVDLLAAHQLKEAILVEVIRRERTGQAGHVTTSLFASAVASLANQASGFLKAGVVPQRLGTEHPSICPYGMIIDAGDGLPMVLAVGADAQFGQLCDILGCPELARDARFARNRDRVLHRGVLNALLRERVRETGMTRDALLRECSSRRVPAGAVNDMAAVFAQPQAERVVARGPGGEFLGTQEVAWAVDGAAPPPTARPPPRYAEHTEEVLREVLGLGTAEIAGLAECGAIALRAGQP